MRAKQIEYLGIDFGSSNTLVAAYAEGVAEPILFSDEESGVQFKTVLEEKLRQARALEEQTRAARGRLLATERPEEERALLEQLERSKLEIGRLSDEASSLKERLLETNGAENVRSFFLELRRRLDTCLYGERDPATGRVTREVPYDFSQVKGICFGHPAYYEKTGVELFCKEFREILSEIFGVAPSRITAVSEPLLDAYALAYAAERGCGAADRVKNGQNVLVMDLGGHTADLSLVRLARMERRILARPLQRSASSDRPVIGMGKAITEELCDACYGRFGYDPVLEAAKCELFSGGDWESRTVERVLKTSANGKGRVRLTYHSVPEQEESCVRLSMSGDGSIGIRRIYRRLSSVVLGYLEAGGLHPRELDHVLLTGGTSRIAPLREHLIASLRDGGWWRDPYRPSVILMDDASGASSAPLMREHTLAEAGPTEKLSSDTAVVLGAVLVAKGFCSATEEAELEKAVKRGGAGLPWELAERMYLLLDEAGRLVAAGPRPDAGFLLRQEEFFRENPEDYIKSFYQID